jgi:hypothetical protein
VVIVPVINLRMTKSNRDFYCKWEAIMLPTGGSNRHSGSRSQRFNAAAIAKTHHWIRSRARYIQFTTCSRGNIHPNKTILFSVSQAPAVEEFS